MTNDYLPEFIEKVDCFEFVKWMKGESKLFCYNMMSLNKAEENKELREWISDFLSWSEYEDNKNDS